MRPLKVPLKLVVATVAVAGTVGGAGCGPRTYSNGSGPCPSYYICTSDAARAVGCGDAAPPSGVFVSDLGTCEPPV